jgi:uncharacterized protein YdhG (YjbR/CyaY superfamily)
MKVNPTAVKREVTRPGAAKSPAPRTIDEYIAGFPPEVQQRLQTVRHAIAKAAPGAEEVISYRIAGFKLHGYLIYFAGFKKHIGMYPARIEKLKQELAAYGGGKGTVQFPLDEPLPLDLITRIVKHRVQENLEKAKAKRAVKKKVVAKPKSPESGKKAVTKKAAAKQKK